MGTYLSTPASQKCKEWGEQLDCPVLPLRWAVVDMQGWRKSMEDAHVADVTLEYPPGLPYLDKEEVEAKGVPKGKVFGVFDGHGGPEVARFCQLYMVSVLSQQALWQQSDEKPLGTSNLGKVESLDAGSSEIGKSLIECFHALDRMIDQPARREEIMRLNAMKPPSIERRVATNVPPKVSVQPIRDFTGPGVVDLAAQQVVSSPQTTLDVKPSPEVQEEESNEEKVQTATTSDADPASDSPSEEPEKEEREDAKTASSDDSGDANSDSTTGLSEAVRDQEWSDDEDSNDDVNINPYANGEAPSGGVNRPPNENGAISNVPNKVSFIIQRLLNTGGIGGQSGQVVIRVGDEGENSEGDTANPAQTIAPVPAPVTGPSVLTPSIYQNGRMICNLPDHPIHAGCTAVVGVLLGRVLTVANAGDSRGVLCRKGGLVQALSFDHKPQQAREMARISAAGGFVNRFGRVNGNLNLSRSIGDLKYKQVPGITPAEQMITAEPDILQVTLDPEDEFFLLGCDGIWDCLTNEQAVRFVRDRIDTQEPKLIGEEMLNSILSEDPRVTQGIGGDNMTILIVDLQPHTRSYTVEPQQATETPQS